jgi:hypothetical protein
MRIQKEKKKRARHPFPPPIRQRVPNLPEIAKATFSTTPTRDIVERKLSEEVSVTNSLAMLTAIPGVDLGMECVSNTPSPSPFSS